MRQTPLSKPCGGFPPAFGSGCPAETHCACAPEPEKAEALVASIDEMVKQAPWRYSDAVNRVLLGNHYLQNGADAKQVLEVFFDRAKRSAPSAAGPYVAAGELALRKGDFKMAGDEFQQALKREETNPRALLGLAQAFLESDTKKGVGYLEQALNAHPRHVPSLLLLAEREIDGELYDEARKTLDKVLAVNPDEPSAWALLSVIEALEGKDQESDLMRQIALGWWAANPEVDHLIGAKLSRHYRFARGAELQRKVLKLSPDHVGATLQLSQDLLRLGQEGEGWKLANRSLEMDGYSVLAHNLVQLQQALDKFTTLKDDDFIVRMDAVEAAVYGDQVLELLQAARRELCAKYNHQLRTPVIVEIFPRQADFAIRTFGMPGGEGFLGVCFGSVITANSPASQGDSPSNWASVLWHEFCHVVTLQKTNNRMPRWLSEGLSVYEERQRRASWGQTMTPRYRQMITSGQLTPVSQLSNAFLKPPSPMHLQFAYYESSLVVEYLVEQHGWEPMLRVLNELGQGMPINDALARTAGSIEALDQGFAKFAEERAMALAPKADWTKMPEDVAGDTVAREQWLEQHPQSLAGMRRRIQQLIKQEQWDQAIELLETQIAWLPEEDGPGSAREALAKIYQKRGDNGLEQDAWQSLLQVDSDHLEGCRRLMELAAESEDWELANWAGGLAGEINPLQTGLQRDLGSVSLAAGDHETAARAWNALIALGPADPAGAHFQLAKAYLAQGRRADAKRQALAALAEAPRYAEAQRLLLSIVDGDGSGSGPKPPWLPPLESLETME